jgi:hypothetical protein
VAIREKALRPEHHGRRRALNSALEKYRPGQSELILVGGNKVIKPALRLMTNYRLLIEEKVSRKPEHDGQH